MVRAGSKPAFMKQIGAEGQKSKSQTFCLFARRAGDGGFCGSRRSSHVQNLRAGTGTGRLPDGETEHVRTLLPGPLAAATLSCVPGNCGPRQSPDGGTARVSQSCFTSAHY